MKFRRYVPTINDIVMSMANHYALQLTPTFVEETIWFTPGMYARIFDDEFDTCAREWLLQEIALRIGAGQWPCGDTADIIADAFFDRLPAALRAHGQDIREGADFR